jgi:hypothetical protein
MKVATRNYWPALAFYSITLYSLAVRSLYANSQVTRWQIVCAL